MPKAAKKPYGKRAPELDITMRTLEERAFDWVKANQTMASIVAAVVVAALALILGVRHYHASQEEGAMALFGQAQAAIGPEGMAPPDQLPAALASLKAVSDKYPNTKAARYAELQEANLLYGAGRAPEAAKLYQDVLTRFRSDDELELLAKQGLAYSKLAAGDLAGAQKLFQELAGAKLGATAAQLNLGLIYERQGKGKEAVAAYQQAVKGGKGPDVEIARARLDALKGQGHAGA